MTSTGVRSVHIYISKDHSATTTQHIILVLFSYDLSDQVRTSSSKYLAPVRGELLNTALLETK